MHLKAHGYGVYSLRYHPWKQISSEKICFHIARKMAVPFESLDTEAEAVYDCVLFSTSVFKVNLKSF